MNHVYSETDQPPRLSRRESLIAVARGAVLALLAAGAVFLTRRGGTVSCSAGSSAVCARCRHAAYCGLVPAREYREAIGHTQQRSRVQPGGALGENATAGRSRHGDTLFTVPDSVTAREER